MPRTTHPARRRLALGALALTSAALLAACGSTADHTGMSGMSGPTAPASGSSAGHSAGDVMFAQMMTPHHQQAVEMADLALDQRAGASSEVRRLATDIKSAQGPEIRTMQGWLAAWGAPTAAAMEHGMPGIMSETDMAALASATGSDFDKQWLTMMIAHHEGAVTMARDVLSSTADSDVRALAEAVVSAQEGEIAAMKGLLG